jgi:excisionase family DNA binding protein
VIAGGLGLSPARHARLARGGHIADDLEAQQLELSELVDIETLALQLDVGERDVRRLIAARRIPYVKWGRLIRFDLAAVREWVEAAKRPARGGA